MKFRISLGLLLLTSFIATAQIKRGLRDKDFVMYYNPHKNVGLEVYKSPKEIDPNDFIWDGHSQKLIVLKWPEDSTRLNVKIVPGIRNFKEPEE